MNFKQDKKAPLINGAVSPDQGDCHQKHQKLFRLFRLGLPSIQLNRHFFHLHFFSRFRDHCVSISCHSPSLKKVQFLPLTPCLLENGSFLSWLSVLMYIQRCIGDWRHTLTLQICGHTGFFVTPGEKNRYRMHFCLTFVCPLNCN